LTREAPQLATVLKEIKEGLDIVRNKVQALTAKVSKQSF
jgi:U3 small nucleolar ribonucleoprotein protein LCP5